MLKKKITTKSSSTKHDYIDEEAPLIEIEETGSVKKRTANMNVLIAGIDEFKLENVQMQLKRNETCVFVGKTGVGKSTICNSIYGKIEFSSGCSIDGKGVTKKF